MVERVNSGRADGLLASNMKNGSQVRYGRMQNPRSRLGLSCSLVRRMNIAASGSYKPFPLGKSRLLAYLLLACSVTIGCTVGPDYVPPVVDSPTAWHEVDPDTDVSTGKTSATNPTAIIEVAWWKMFADPTLESLIDEAAESNLDLKQAQARLRESRAFTRIEQAGLFPEISSFGAYRRSHPAGGGGASTGTSVLYQAGFDASWELDIFGGVRRSIEAANADAQASLEAERDVMVSLFAEVARTYVELRAVQKEIEIANANLEIQQKSVGISKQRFDAGFVSNLDVVNAEAQVAVTKARLPSLETLSKQGIFALSVLLGKMPTDLLPLLSSGGPLPMVPPEVPVGLPSELLLRRPDIRQAESSLHASVARVGVETANLFPKFSLTGALGGSADVLRRIAADDNRSWSIIPGVTWPVFSAGRISASVDASQAQAEVALLAYRKTVLEAFKEVEGALTSYSNEQVRRQSLKEAVEANKKAVSLATTLYVQGQTDFLNVIAATRELLDTEDSLARSDQSVCTNLIALYKALGGGWQDEGSSG